MEKKRLHYIDGYKGLLCLMIMVGHFWNIYRLTSGASPPGSQSAGCLQ